MVWKAKIKATRLDKIDIRKMIFMDAIGNLAFNLMKKRVMAQHRGDSGRALAPYRVKVDKVQSRQGNNPWEERKPNVGSGWTKKGPPPDIYNQIRVLGGVNKKGTDWKGGEPIRYSMRSPVKEKRGQIWGYHWDSKSAFLSANYGGSQVDHKRTGSMWANKRIKATAVKGKDPFVTVGFKGAVPKGSVFDIISARKAGDKERANEGKKARKVNASTKALLANSRGKDGKLTMENPNQWLGISEKEMQQIVTKLDKDFMKKLDGQKVEIKVVT